MEKKLAENILLHLQVKRLQNQKKRLKLVLKKSLMFSEVGNCEKVREIIYEALAN
jgi:hypothetical protein